MRFQSLRFKLVFNNDNSTGNIHYTSHTQYILLLKKFFIHNKSLKKSHSGSLYYTYYTTIIGG